MEPVPTMESGGYPYKEISPNDEVVAESGIRNQGLLGRLPDSDHLQPLEWHI